MSLVTDTILFRREWAMPSADTFDIPCIAGFVQKYLLKSKMSIDPFARNKRWATYTNDLNPDTAATVHMDAREFISDLCNRGVVADLVFCDPPYSQVQVSRAYANIGKLYKPFGDDNNAVLYRETRDGLHRLLQPGGIALSFGWNSSGFGEKRGYEILEILLVCHGGAHNDTICVAERRTERAPDLFQNSAGSSNGSE